MQCKWSIFVTQCTLTFKKQPPQSRKKIQKFQVHVFMQYIQYCLVCLTVSPNSALNVEKLYNPWRAKSYSYLAYHNIKTQPSPKSIHHPKTALATIIIQDHLQEDMFKKCDQIHRSWTVKAHTTILQKCLHSQASPPERNHIQHLQRKKNALTKSFSCTDYKMYRYLHNQIRQQILLQIMQISVPPDVQQKIIGGKWNYTSQISQD